jgi:MFS family permease
MLFVQGEWSFYVLRFLLGIFEAGFFPGVTFYLTCWYSHQRMAGVMAVVMRAGPIGGAFGGPLSTWIMTRFDGTAGMQGWQWMFLLEGLPCVFLGVIAFFYLVDRPEHARWLSAREKKLLADDLSNQNGTKDTHLFRDVLRDKRVYALAVPYFSLVCGIYAVSFWLPTLLQSKGISDTMRIGLYSALPYLLAIVAMVWLARRSDRLEERRWHIAGCPFGSGSRTLPSDGFVAALCIFDELDCLGHRANLGCLRRVLGNAVALLERRSRGRGYRAYQQYCCVGWFLKPGCHRLDQNCDGFV